MILEICVDTAAGIDAAVSGRADRIELCAALALGGLTPPPSLIAVAACAPIPAHMLVRPREGSFHYTRAEAAMIAADMTAAAGAGLAGVVIGASRVDHTLDLDLLAQFVAHADTLGLQRGTPLSLTLHRAIDLCPAMPEALDAAIALGFARVLTSGGQPKAIDGLTMLATLHRRAAGRIAILAGSGIDADIVAPILDTGIREIHASCGSPAKSPGASSLEGSPGPVADEGVDDRERRFGFGAVNPRATDPDRIAALRAMLDRHAD